MTKDDPDDTPSIDVADSYAIYPHRDHVTQSTIPFFLDDYGDSGVFSEQQASAISQHHDLSTLQVRELSRLVGYALDIDTHANFVTISQSKVESRLQNRKPAKLGCKNSLTAEEANTLFQSLGLDLAVVDETVRYPESTTPGGSDVEPISLDQAQRILQPDDLRKERDSRRLLVVECCCYIALDAGWPITYTTDSTALKDQRGGRLINLIKDVIAMVSQNNRAASVHTLKADIEMVRLRFQSRGDLPNRKPT